jgi:hypothetical protein
MQKSVFPQKFKKVCLLQRRACNKFKNFKRRYLENYNDSKHAIKTKNAPFFMIFPNISFFHMIVTYWTGLLSVEGFATPAVYIRSRSSSQLRHRGPKLNMGEILKTVNAIRFSSSRRVKLVPYCTQWRQNFMTEW